jgi:glutathione S-transferase
MDDEVLELVGLDRCPFVQRTVITLKRKQIPFRLTYIDLDNPPGWFHGISPFGKVPLLKVPGKGVLFESAVINEYLDETHPGRLHPEDPFLRAQNRAWIEFGSATFMDAFNMIVAPDEAGMKAQLDALWGKLARLETVVVGPYFNGEHFSLVDSALAPLFSRLNLLSPWVQVIEPGKTPKVAAWGEQLLGLPEVQTSLPPDIGERYQKFLRQKGGYFRTLMGP